MKIWLMWLDRLLVANVFLVLLGFGWFAVAVVGQSTGVNLGWDLWLTLWQPLFNPAIGILFLGAFASWLIKKFNQYFQAKISQDEPL
ncbi:MAG: hypothetical protein ACPGVO_13405 [Spirulinaceae cyanobacterium]